MSSNICRFSFDIAAWQASSDKIAAPEQWPQWASGTLNTDTLPECRPALAFLPAMQRRRLGKAARLICDASWDLAEQYPGIPLVYASHDGEINRSFELWVELLQTRSISPTSFGLSVHNAPAGQWSMLRGDMGENTALAAGSDNFETALAEAFALLQEGAASVLVLVADDPLTVACPVQATRAPFAYALALVLTRGESYTLSLDLCDTSSENGQREFRQNGSGLQVPPYWGALDWIRFMLSDDPSKSWQHGSRRWTWCKKP